MRTFSSNSKGEKNRNQIIFKKTYSDGNMELLRGKESLKIDFFISFIFSCAESSWLGRLFSSWVNGVCSRCSAQASHCRSFSCWGAQAPGHSGFSSCGAQAQWLCSRALEHRLGSCGARAQLLHNMWDLSHALASEPPGKPKSQFLEGHGILYLHAIFNFYYNKSAFILKQTRLGNNFSPLVYIKRTGKDDFQKQTISLSINVFRTENFCNTYLLGDNSLEVIHISVPVVSEALPFMSG